MSPRRRSVLCQVSTLGLVGLAGCLDAERAGSESSTTDSPATTTEPCSATDPPEPTTAHAPPKSYPEKPAELTTETVRDYVRAYERSYQYNRQLERYPDKMGRTNEVDVSLLEVTVDFQDTGFAVEVSGQINVSISYSSEDSETATPSTPTATPLPDGHQPFSTSYLVTDRLVRRNGIVVDCS